MAQSFDYNQDSALVSWKETLIYNIIRITVGGALLFLVSLAGPQPLWGMLGAGIGWLVVGLPMWLLCQKLPATPKGIVALVFVVPFFFLGLLADPVIFIVSKVNPSLIPVVKPGFMTFNAVIFILKA